MGFLTHFLFGFSTHFLSFAPVLTKHIIIQSEYEKVKDDKGLGTLQIKLQNENRRSPKQNFFDFFRLHGIWHWNFDPKIGSSGDSMKGILELLRINSQGKVRTYGVRRIRSRELMQKKTISINI